MSDTIQSTSTPRTDAWYNEALPLTGDILRDDADATMSGIELDLNEAREQERILRAENREMFLRLEAAVKRAAPSGSAFMCPVCGHKMTEDESKMYRGCPTGVHAVQHVRA